MDEEKITGMNERRRGMTTGGWRALVGKGVLAAFVVVGMAGCSFGGGPALSEFQPGECIAGDGDMPLYGLRGLEVLEVIDCAEADPTVDYKIVFAEEAVGESYPGNLVEINFRCVDESGWILEPSSATWENGDRVAFCLEPTGPASS